MDDFRPTRSSSGRTLRHVRRSTRLSTASASDTDSVKVEKKENKKRKVVTIEDNSTKPRRRRVSTTPTISGPSGRIPGRKSSLSSEESEPPQIQVGLESSVVTPCKSRKRCSTESELPTFGLSPSVSSTSTTSSVSTSSQLPKLNLPPNVTNIDDCKFEPPPLNPYNKHTSALVINKAFMRDYGRDHFHLLDLRENNEYNNQKESVSIRVTRSKRQILSEGDSSVSTVPKKSPYYSPPSPPKNLKHPADRIFILGQEFDYMANQPYLSHSMRSLLLDWFVELSEEYKLKSETLHLAVKVLDRVLSKCERRTKKERLAYMKYKEDKKNGKMIIDISSDSGSDCLEERTSNSEKSVKPYTHKGFIVNRHTLQCVGCACMLLATKFEEIKPPSSNDFAYISDATYTPKQIARMEMKICTHLKFNIRGVTPMMFFHRFICASQEGDSQPKNPVLENLCLYLLELSFLEYQFVGVKSSLLMAATLYLARATLGIRSKYEIKPKKVPSYNKSSRKTSTIGQFWSPTLEFYTGYDMWALEDTVKLLHKLQYRAEERTDGLDSAFGKYKVSKYLRVALKTALDYKELGF